MSHRRGSHGRVELTQASVPMPEKPVPENIRDKFLTCAVCLSEYKDPRFLPCLHTFCKKCIGDLIVALRTRREISPLQRLILRCPICRHKVDVTDLGRNWDHNFPKNFVITSLEDEIRKSGENKPTEQTSELASENPSSTAAKGDAAVAVTAAAAAPGTSTSKGKGAKSKKKQSSDGEDAVHDKGKGKHSRRGRSVDRTRDRSTSVGSHRPRADTTGAELALSKPGFTSKGKRYGASTRKKKSSSKSTKDIQQPKPDIKVLWPDGERHEEEEKEEKAEEEKEVEKPLATSTPVLTRKVEMKTLDVPEASGSRHYSPVRTFALRRSSSVSLRTDEDDLIQLNSQPDSADTSFTQAFESWAARNTDLPNTPPPPPPRKRKPTPPEAKAQTDGATREDLLGDAGNLSGSGLEMEGGTQPNPPKRSPSTKQKPVLCQKHTRPCRHYCSDCKAALCSLCYDNHAKEHTVMELKQKIVECQESIAEFLRKIPFQRELIKASEKRAQVVEKEMGQRKRQVRQKVERRRRELRLLVDQIADDLLTELESVDEMEKARLQDELDSYQTHEAALTSLEELGQKLTSHKPPGGPAYLLNREHDLSLQLDGLDSFKPLPFQRESDVTFLHPNPRVREEYLHKAFGKLRIEKLRIESENEAVPDA